MAERALYARQRMILALLLRACGVERARLIAWLFFAGRERGIGGTIPFYEFVPREEGPFSFLADHELSGLVARGLVTSAGAEVRIVEGAVADARREVDRLAVGARAALEGVLREVGELDRDALLERVRERDPWYASRSGGVGVGVGGRAAPGIYTSGYEGVSIDAFLGRLLRAGVERVIDVRRSAYSMKYGFSGRVLGGACEALGIEWVHEPELGIASAERRALAGGGADGGAEARAELFARYEREMLPSAAEARARVERMVLEAPSALVCFEGRAEDCHRAVLARVVGSRVGRGVVDL